MDEWMDGWMDRWIDRYIDRYGKCSSLGQVLSGHSQGLIDELRGVHPC